MPGAPTTRFSSLEQYLVDATLALPPSVASAMEEALATGNYLVRAGSYGEGSALCPLGAADVHTNGSGLPSNTGTFDGLGGRLLRFAVAFDLCAAESGDEEAVRVVQGALQWT